MICYVYNVYLGLKTYEQYKDLSTKEISELVRGSIENKIKEFLGNLEGDADREEYTYEHNVS